ncbi:MAG: hypothetical protein IKR41_09800 [Bacteroidales bacterium]|nr:hypothetical protein [Bacteroidales bacterium]
MKYNFFKPIVTVIAIVSISFYSSCENEDLVVAESSNKIDLDQNEIPLPDSIAKTWIIPPHESKLSKGFVQDERSLYSLEDFDETDSLLKSVRYAYHRVNKDIKYEVMKVYRRNSDKFFYVMTTNLDYKVGNGCWVYNNDEKNAAYYGRLYTWETATKLASEFFLNLPLYNKDGKKLLDSYPTPGRLMKFEDVCDIIERDNIANLPQYGVSIDDFYGFVDDSLMLYYDAFVGGLDLKSDNLPARVLAGGRSREGVYSYLNDFGEFWLINGNPASPEFHYTLCIEKYFRGANHSVEYFNHAAYVNHMIMNTNAVSVRYVFEPIYRKR